MAASVGSAAVYATGDLVDAIGDPVYATRDAVYVTGEPGYATGNPATADTSVLATGTVYPGGRTVAVGIGVVLSPGALDVNGSGSADGGAACAPAVVSVLSIRAAESSGG